MRVKSSANADNARLSQRLRADEKENTAEIPKPKQFFILLNPAVGDILDTDGKIETKRKVKKMLQKQRKKLRIGRSAGTGHYLFFAAVAVLMSVLAVMGAADISVPDSIAFTTDGESVSPDNIRLSPESAAAADSTEHGVNALVTDFDAEAKLGPITLKNVGARAVGDVKLVPCGTVFGIKFFTKGVVVVGTSEIETASGRINPALKAGLAPSDVIEKVNGIEVNTVEEIAQITEAGGGEVMSILFERDGKRHETSLLPVLSLTDKKYKSGLWIRDSTAGIGTVTYYDPESGVFAGLGHGICDIDTGKLMPLLRGTVVDIELTDIIKGEKGHPGELKGTFGTLRRGSLIGNTELGVYGLLDEAPEGVDVSAAIPIALSDEIKVGRAEILSTVTGGGVGRYEIEITKLYKSDTTNKSFVFRITDPELTSLTGGIVQGMSGSPIIQDGRLVGAVTHVMINDPEKGYGVYIENMLGNSPKLAA